MRHWRNLICFLFGVVLAAHGVVAFAETIAATPTSNPAKVARYVYGNPTKTYVDAQAACTVVWATHPTWVPSTIVTTGSGPLYSSSCTWSSGSGLPYNGYGNLVNMSMACPPAANGDTYNGAGTCPTTYSCPAGGNWTLSGQSCTRPDCVAPQTMQSDGTCKAPCPMWAGVDDPSIPTNQPSTCACPAGTTWNVGCRKTCGGGITPGQSANAGWDMVIPKGQTEACWGGCGIQHVSGSYSILKDGSRMAPATYTGWACSGNGPGTKDPTGTPAPDTTKKDKALEHDPKCGANEGVVTVSTGKILCLPSGSDVSVPQVQNTKKVETFADNSTKTTETTKTTDPATSVSDTRSTITATGGLSGSAGTSSTVENSSGNSSGTGTGADGSGGTCDPKSDFCGGPGTGGLYQKKARTVAGVLGDFKTGLMSSSIGTAGTSFFTVSVPGGSCPAWAVDVAALNVHLDVSQYFCTATALNMMNLVGSVLMFVAAFVGFRWAIL